MGAGRSGHRCPSANAKRLLDCGIAAAANGFGDVSDVIGGITAWSAANLPVVSAATVRVKATG